MPTIELVSHIAGILGQYNLQIMKKNSIFGGSQINVGNRIKIDTCGRHCNVKI
jgi:hypothetical protein